MLRPAALLLAAAGLAAQEIGGPIEDVRLHAGMMLSPSAIQRGTLTTGGEGEAEWKDTDAVHPYVGIDYVAGAAHRGRGSSGLVWGAGLHVAQMDLTPGTYRVDGVDTDVTAQPTITYREYGLGGQLGWATRPDDTGFGDWHVELVGVLRGGPLQGQVNRTRLVAGSPETERSGGWGWWYAGGPQVGIYLADQGWLLGLSAEWLFGRGAVDFGGGDRVALTRNGPGLAVQLGWRR